MYRRLFQTVKMNAHTTHVDFAGRIVIVGFGSIGQGSLPLILRHIGTAPEKITIVSGDERGRAEAEKLGVAFRVAPLTRDNYRQSLEPLLGSGDFLLNLSVDVSSVDLIRFCREKGALYLDTCIEPWPGGYTDPNLPMSARTNYALREQAMELRREGGGPTAVITHGANPGLVSHFLKQALLDIARDTASDCPAPTSKKEWAELAERLGVRTIHIAERDTQVANIPKSVGEFVNTWSIDGFVSEGLQPAELGWGTHERTFPIDGERQSRGCGAAIFLHRPGASQRVRTWTPTEGPFHGFLITHGESISIADYLSVRVGDEVRYRPTVHYAYHPCDDAVLSVHEMAGKMWRQQSRQRLLMDEIVSGIDELGVLVAGHQRNAYWFGSQLSIDEARALAPYNNATSLQVTVSVLSGMVWAIENPERGVVEPDEMDFQRNLEIAMPYLGPVVGHYTEWTPVEGRGDLFDEDLDPSNPWQFRNVRVN
jgi:homospermidine synthase